MISVVGEYNQSDLFFLIIPPTPKIEGYYYKIEVRLIIFTNYRDHILPIGLTFQRDVTQNNELFRQIARSEVFFYINKFSAK